MAELAIRSVSGKHRSVYSTIEVGRATIHSVNPTGANSVAEIAIRGYDASRDLLFSVPNGETIDRSRLDWELDLHIPSMLSIQTEEHWFASAIPGYVLIQPILVHKSVVSPLEALRSIVTSLTGDHILLHCEEGSMLAMESQPHGVVIQSAGVGIAEYAAMEVASRERIISLRSDCHILLSGSEVTREVVAQLNLWRSHGFERIGPQHLLACADIDSAELTSIDGDEHEYALLVGAAAHFAIERDTLLVVR